MYLFYCDYVILLKQQC